MKRHFSGKKVMRIICLLFSVGILLYIRYPVPVYAAERETNLTGTTDERTTLREPGESESQEELRELNIGNTFAITYNDGNGQLNGTLRILITLTLIAIAPTLIIMLTSFTRIIIVLHFTRAALNTQTAPPNQVLIGLALFLTFFIMQPTLTAVYENAVVPFEAGEIDQEEALKTGMEPFREFMYGQTQKKDVRLFLEISNTEWEGDLESIPSSVLWMEMLPPTTISMPFKILLFVLADGWNLIIGSLVKTFY